MASYRSTTKLVETAERRQHTQEVLEKLSNLLSKILDAETGARGYIITGEESFLEPFHAAMGAIDQGIKEVRTLTADNLNQQRRLNILELLIARKLALVAERIELRRIKGFDAARQVALTHEGKELMDDIRTVIREMGDEEKQLFDQRDEDAKASARNTISIIAVGSVLAFGLVSLAIFFINRDITERKRAEAELHARARQQAAIAELGQRALTGTDLAMLMDEAVALVAETLGVEYGKVLELLPDGQALRLRAGVGWKEGSVGQAIVSAGAKSQAGYTLLSSEPVIVEDLRTETRFTGPPLLRDHSVVSGLSVIIPGRDRPFGILGAHTCQRRSFTRDDTHFVQAVANVLAEAIERKQAEEEIRAYQRQLQSLASELSLAEERERRRIATALHDHTVQTLALTKIKLGGLREAAASTPLAGDLDQLRELLEQTIQATRALSFEMSPPLLYELGLEAAVEWLAEQTQQQHGLRVEFEDDGQPKPLDDSLRVLLFMAVRELMVNIVKHAQARNVKLSIRRDGDNIRINVEDDGIGFGTSKPDAGFGQAGGFGLFSIRERIGHLGGCLIVASEPGHGTRMTLVAPLTQEMTVAKGQ